MIKQKTSKTVIDPQIVNIDDYYYEWYYRTNVLETTLKKFSLSEPFHAYLITGPKGCGKRTYAEALAAALYCTDSKRPCRKCAACSAFYSNNNPDVFRLYSEDNKNLKIDEIRSIITSVNTYSFSNGYRVVLVEPLEKVSPAGQNALLKSLEEPVENVVFILMAHELGAALGTIASRCIRIKMPSWDDESLKSALQLKGFSEKQINNTLPLCAGNIGTALHFLNNDGHNDHVFQLISKVLAAVCDSDCLSISTALKDDKDNAETFLFGLEQEIHKSLLVRTGQLRFESLSDLPPVWSEFSMKTPVEVLRRMLGIVFTAREKRSAQVNWQSTVDQMLISLLEERKIWQK